MGSIACEVWLVPWYLRLAGCVQLCWREDCTHFLSRLMNRVEMVDKQKKLMVKRSVVNFSWLKSGAVWS